MTEDVGQAQLKQSEDTNGFFPGQLESQFSKGGVSEIEELLNAEVLSMEDFLRAERSLERTPATLDEIEMADVLATTHIEDGHDKETFNYSLKETGREQNGGAADENTETSLGRRKLGIQDPDAYKKKQEKKISQYRQLEVAMQQQLYLDNLYAELDQIRRDIERYKQEIERAEQNIEQLSAQIEQDEHLLEDLDSSDPSRKRSARANIDALARRTGIDTSNFDDDDRRRFQEQRIADAQAAREKEQESKRQSETGLGNSEEKLDDIIEEIRTIDPDGDGAIALSAPETGHRQFASADERGLSSFDSAESELASLNALDSFDGGDAFGSSDIEVANLNAFDSFDDDSDAFDNLDSTPNTGFSFDESEQIALEDAFDSESATGSFSGSDANSVITAHFAAKVNPDQAAPDPDPEANDLDTQDKTLPTVVASTSSGNAFTA